MLQSVPVNENLSSASSEPSLHWMLGGIQRDNTGAHLPKLRWGPFNLLQFLPPLASSLAPAGQNHRRSSAWSYPCLFSGCPSA